MLGAATDTLLLRWGVLAGYQCDDIEEFPAGTYYTPETGYVNYYQPAFLQEGFEHDPNSARLTLLFCPM